MISAAVRAAAARVRVLVIGSLNVDLILVADREPVDESAVTVRSVSTEVGGHAGNCAAALAALGVSVAVAGAVGADDDGDRLVADLRGRGVDVAAVRRRAEPTGRVVIPVFGDRHYMLLCRGANDTFGPTDLREALAGDYDAVMLFDPPRDALRAVGACATLLCWTPGGVFAGDPVTATVLPHTDILFVNRFEHDELATAPGPDTDVVITLGAVGSTLRRGAQEVTVHAHPVPVVDPTGAGDAFAAAYLLAHLAGLPPSSRLAAGNAAGALAVGAVGARGRPATVPDLLSALTRDRP
ncbi:PfkB family carbohydrate kinase [Actinokineospora sp. NBRC 105648]|uniref:carbohydrate kinase family protein n=1 Tax=Actinokineospora sp. NBRC 105648 TaxID=3032206 RepID=UPI0024A45285|nr:PfkB family carbohydrate kinase [Actinokineospora sp. NBRC 105648]GLZ37110.1 hypothetical protein Acsp05_07350 [Actinokineospora sp. NBRC 105648]